MGLMSDFFGTTKDEQAYRYEQELKLVEKELQAQLQNKYPGIFQATASQINVMNANMQTAAMQAKQEAQRRPNPNDIPAMQMPLEALVDLWEVKWQDKWVSLNEAAADEFWRWGHKRLLNAQRLEKFEDYYRIIPNANR